MPDAGTIFILILVPVWAFGSGILLNWAGPETPPETPSDQFTDSVVGCFGTVLWAVQLALMGLSMRLSWFTPVISIPASVVFYYLGTEISAQRNKKDELIPFFETWVVAPVTDEQKSSVAYFL